MFEEKFEKLGMMDQESFKRIVNWLLAHTFLLQAEYDFNDSMRRSNRDYLFVDRHFELFQDYLEYSGFRLERDTNYGVVSLASSFDFNRQKFDKMTTLMVYVLRLIYEEEREKLSLSSDIFTTTGDLVHKMISLGIIRKKPADAALRDSLRRLFRFQIIDKPEGAWEAAGTRLLILPTILFIVTNQRISNMYELLEDGGAANADVDIDEDAGGDEALDFEAVSYEEEGRPEGEPPGKADLAGEPAGKADLAGEPAGKADLAGESAGKADLAGEPAGKAARQITLEQAWGAEDVIL